MVIESHPILEDGSPFPTLYWLTCPILNKRVSTLESGGSMAAVTERLEVDVKLKQRLADALARYRARRDSHVVIKESGGPPGGGPDRVKCLHAHVAHELAGGDNPIGSLTLTATAWPDCVAPCVQVDQG
ncbi:MAG: uncharacterized protein QOG16_1570 [Actinomycetota bacterium]|jgi:hypothetical protein|nr:uncharacterized protein [Actinomycetota bacterium]